LSIVCLWSLDVVVGAECCRLVLAIARESRGLKREALQHLHSEAEDAVLELFYKRIRCAFADLIECLSRASVAQAYFDGVNSEQARATESMSSSQQ
jgi:hypothetical protein